MEKVVEIWTDGACKGNPGPGGWGVLLRYGEHEKTCCGGEPYTTNNRMEMMAVIQALQQLKRPVPVRLYSDSVYVQKGVQEWMPAWVARGWKTAGKTPVKNQDLWEQLHALTQRFDIEWVWVKGHSGDPGNERADALANQGVSMVRKP